MHTRLTEPLTMVISLIGDTFRMNIRRSRPLIKRINDSNEEMVNELRL